MSHDAGTRSMPNGMPPRVQAPMPVAVELESRPLSLNSRPLSLNPRPMSYMGQQVMAYVVVAHIVVAV